MQTEIEKYLLPDNVIKYIQFMAHKSNFNLDNHKSVAEAVQKQSDFYIENPTQQTPWQDSYSQMAQISYYFPLNFLRNLRVFQQIKDTNFFDGIENYIELGSGLSPSYLALKQIFPDQTFQKSFFVESSNWAQRFHEKIAAENPTLYNYNIEGNKTLQWLSHFSIDKKILQKSILVCSYSLTELTQLPPWIFDCKAVIILEPSTRQDGQRLIQWRKELTAKGYSTWAPCLHQNKCPLDFDKSKDWCHDRIHIQLPEYLEQAEKHLPFKNSTLTLSYLIIHKQSPPKKYTENFCRVIGDFLDEKGKTRQLVCRNSNREFLTVLKRNNLNIEYQRGDIIQLANDYSLVGNEIRINKK